MNLRLADETDIETVEQFAWASFLSSGYNATDYDPGRVREIVAGLVASKKEDAIIILAEDPLPVGVIAGLCSPALFSRAKSAAELIFWVNPEARGRTGLILHKTFEKWARQVGCTRTQVVAFEHNNDRVGKFYQRLGYSPVEHTYMKEL